MTRITSPIVLAACLLAAGSPALVQRGSAQTPDPARAAEGAPGTSPFNGPRDVRIPEGGADVALAKIGDFYFADVRVHGRPYRFTLETGGNALSVSGRLARELGLAQTGTAEIVGGGNAPTVRIDSISIGTATFLGLAATVTDRWATQDPAFDGIISIPLLRRLLVTLDLSRGRMRLERGALPEPDGRTVVPIAGRDRAGRPDLLLRLGRAEVGVVLDTRSAIPLLVPAALAEQLSFAAPPVAAGQAMGPTMGTFQLQRARLATDAALGPFSIRQPWLMLRDRPGALAGVPLLEQLVITLDLARGRARLVRADGATEGVIEIPAAEAIARRGGAPSPPRRYMGFGLVPRPDGGRTVAAVAPGSSAERAGLRDGDDLVEFNGVPAANIQPSVLREAAARDDAVPVVVSRDGRRIVLMIAPFVQP